MSDNTNGLFYSGESAQIGQSEESHAQSQVQALQAGNEVEQEANEIAKEQVKLEQAFVEAGNIEKQAQIMQAAVDQGSGLDSSGAQATQQAVEAALFNLGVPASQRKHYNTVLGFENFSGGANNFNSTKLSVEGLWDKLKEIWETIKTKVKAFFQKVVDFFGRFFDNTEAVKKHAEKVQKKAGERSGWTTKKSEVDFGGAAKVFVVESKFSVADADKIFNNHQILTKNIVASFNSMSATVDGVGEFLQKKDDSVLEKAAKKIEGFIDDMAKGTIGFKKSKDGDDAKIIAGPFINGETLVGKFNDKTFNLSLNFVAREKKVENTTGALPSVKAVEQICISVLDLMKTTEEYKTALPKIKALNAELVKLCDAALGVASAVIKTGENTSRLEAGLNKARAATTDLINVGARITVMIPSWNVKLGNAALSICDQWLDNYEDKSKK